MLLSGPIGEHGTAIMLARNQFELEAGLESDTRSLWPAVDALLEAAGPTAALHARRDARRRGLGAQRARARGRCRASASGGGRAVAAVVAAAAELLGIDPMYVANEGRLVAFVAPDGAREALEALRGVAGLRAGGADRRGRAEPPAMVLVETSFGGRRVMDQLVGDPLPRIC